MASRGWRPVPRSHPAYSPTKRLYFDPANRVRSRRAYDNQRLKKTGFESKHDFDFVMAVAKGKRRSRVKDRGLERWLNAAERNLGIPRKELAKSNSEFMRRYIAARSNGFDQDPDGEFSQFLVYIGARNPESDNAVGEGDTAVA